MGQKYDGFVISMTFAVVVHAVMRDYKQNQYFCPPRKLCQCEYVSNFMIQTTSEGFIYNKIL